MNYDIRFDSTLVETMLKAAGRKVYGDDLQRSIRITPFTGAYGTAGYVAVVEGTPPLVTYVLYTSPIELVAITANYTTRKATRYTGTKAMQWVMDYLVSHINKIEKKAVA